MDLDMLVKQVDDVAQLFLGVNVVCPDRPEGDEVNDRGELVPDAMIQLVQKGSSSRANGSDMEWGTAVSLDYLNYTV
jgi:hypothetical protein